MEPQDRILVFLAEFDFQVEQIRGIYETLRKKVPLVDKQPVSQDSVESAGYWLHICIVPMKICLKWLPVSGKTA